MIKVDSELLNAKIVEICEKGDVYPVKGLEDSGKCIPVIGWYWRPVDFNDRITLGYVPAMHTILEQSPGFVGFMENNKWGYDQWVLTEEESDELKARLVAMFSTEVTQEALQGLFDYMQTLRREFEECPDCSGMGEVGGNFCKTCRGFGRVVKGTVERRPQELATDGEAAVAE